MMHSRKSWLPHLVLRNEDALINHFDRMESACGLFLRQQNHPETTRAEEAVYVEFVDRGYLTQENRLFHGWALLYHGRCARSG